MAKVKVLCGTLYHPSGAYPKGAILEMTDEDALVSCEKDKTCELVPDDAAVTPGIPVEVDPVEKEIRRKNFEAAHLVAPPAERDPKAAPIPVDRGKEKDINPIGDFTLGPQ